MRRNIFTGDIIRNRLNLETLFEPIVYFIEIGKLKFPLWKPYMRISLHTAWTRTRKCFWTRINKFWKRDTWGFVAWPAGEMKIIRNNPAFLLEDSIVPKFQKVPKFQVGSLVFSLDPYWPLEYSTIYFIFCFLFVYVIWFYFTVVFLLIGIFLLRPSRINLKTSDSYQNHDDF